MYISSTGLVEGRRVLFKIGRIHAVSAWHAATAPSPFDWSDLALRELVRKAEDVDADAIIGVDCRKDNIVLVSEVGVRLERIVATGTAVKLSFAA